MLFNLGNARVSGHSAGFCLAIHRITDGFGLEGTLRSISRAGFSRGGLLGTLTFFSIAKILSQRSAFSFRDVFLISYSLFSAISPCLSGLLSIHTSLSAVKVLSSAAEVVAGPDWISNFPLRYQETLSCSAQPLLYGKTLCSLNIRNCRVFLCPFITQEDGCLPHNSALPLEKQQSCRGISYWGH